MNLHNHLEPPEISSLGVNIYMDESGDLGFPNGSEYFVFGAVIVKSSSDEVCCKKAVTRARKKLSDSYNYDELKSSKLHGKSRETVFKEILKGSYDFGYCLLRKRDVIASRIEDISFYNWLAPKLVEDIIFKYGFKADVNVIIDKSLNGIQQLEFDRALYSRNLDIFKSLSALEVRIFHCNSKIKHGLQIADLIAGTVYQHYSRYNCDPSDPYNFFPQICERTTVALDFFRKRRK